MIICSCFMLRILYFLGVFVASISCAKTIRCMLAVHDWLGVVIGSFRSLCLCFINVSCQLEELKINFQNRFLLSIEYYNQPLEESTQYQAFFRGFIDESKFSSTDWFSFKTTEKPSTGLSAGAIAGICVSIILIIFLAAVIAFYLKRRHREEEEEELHDATKKRPNRPSFFRGGSSKAVIGECYSYALEMSDDLTIFN